MLSRGRAELRARPAQGMPSRGEERGRGREERKGRRKKEGKRKGREREKEIPPIGRG